MAKTLERDRNHRGACDKYPELGCGWQIRTVTLAAFVGRTLAFIKDPEEEIVALKRSIRTLRHSARDPRELLFADVLLRRPTCTPDTEGILTLRSEETPLT